MTSTPALRRVGAVTGLVYAALLAVIAFQPTPVGESAYPFIIRAVNRLRELGAPHWVSYFAVEFGANILLFVPLGAIVVLFVGPRRWWWGVVLGSAISACIELGQLFFLSHRVATINDVIANTSGAFVGAVLAALVVLPITRRRHALARERTRSAV
jgi:glycopeptide antibiotics resistance protein